MIVEWEKYEREELDNYNLEKIEWKQINIKK